MWVNEPHRLRHIASMPSADLSQAGLGISQRDHLLEVIGRFNADPFSNAITQLCQVMNVEPCLESIAHILQSLPGLDPEKVKQYVLSQSDDRMLGRIFTEHDLQVPLLNAMKYILSRGKMLVGPLSEVVKILRLFRSSYFAKNGSIYESPEMVYYHCLSMIFLNTNLHDPRILHKKTVNDYWNECMRVLTPKINTAAKPSKIYEQIAEEPLDAAFLLPEDFSVTLEAISKRKIERFMQGWESMYLILKNYSLIWYKDAAGAKKNEVKGVIQLSRVKVVCDYEGANTKLRLIAPKELAIVKYQDGKPVFNGGVDKLLLEFQDKRQRDTWFQALKEASVLSGFLEEPPPGMVVAFTRK